MARQARSEATRRRIITSAVELFDEIGYAAAGLGDIIDRLEMTKGALYYHFDSKESLATAIIQEGSEKMFGAFQQVSDASTPALEGIIHGVFGVADVLSTDMVARICVKLLRAFGEFNDAASFAYNGWLQLIAARAAAAMDEGDVREDLDPLAVSETLVGSMLGAEMLASALSSGTDLLQRVTRIWEVLLPSIATDESLPYFREFLARESLRGHPEYQPRRS
jgi:AcrR family transcriptional regulator